MKFDLKKLLKIVKLNEENISMILGAVVLVVVGVLVVNYFKDRGSVNIPGGATEIVDGNMHTVAKGETLWAIAEASYGSGYNWVDIKEANGLTSDAIDVGQKLAIPDDVTPRTPTTTGVSDTSEVVTGLTSISGDTYTVVRGDCLWDIAVRAYGDGFKWVEIAQVNDLVNPDIIHTGNVLLLPR